MSWLCGFALPASAAYPKVEFQLLTMGPGSHLYTRGGHAALMAVHYDSPERWRTKVYNYGEAHFEAPRFPWDYVRGEVQFYLDSPGDLSQTIQKYGIRETRTVYRQALNLSPEQTQELLNRLETELRPENRYYPQHHLKAICTTRIRDLLNDVTKGAIYTQLSLRSDPQTVRDYQWRAFDGFPLAGWLGDLLLGRLHDQPIDQYFALFVPTRMRELLPTVQIDTAQGKRSLAEAPVALVELASPADSELTSYASRIFALTVAALFLVLTFALMRSPSPRVRQLWGVAFFSWSLFSAGMGFVYLFLLGFSSIQEAHQNEWLLLFCVTDITLASTTLRLLRRRTGSFSSQIMAYLSLRCAMGFALLVGRFIGVFYQEPGAFAAMGFAVWGSFLLGARAIQLSSRKLQNLVPSPVTENLASSS